MQRAHRGWLGRVWPGLLVLVLTPSSALAALPDAGQAAAGAPPASWGLAALGLALVLGLAADACASDEELWRIIQASRNKLKAVFDAIRDPICSVTPELRIESVNLALARQAQCHPRELVGLSADELLDKARVGPELRQGILEMARLALQDGRPLENLLESPGADGQYYFEVTATPVPDPNGGVQLAIFQVRDVTLLKRMEQTVREYSQSLEEKVAERTRDLVQAQEDLSQEKELLAEANQELKKLDALRHDLTNMVVHDMKGPLAEVMGNLDLITYDPLNEMQQEALDLASLGAEDLLRMIMNLLDIDRLEEGRLQVRRAPVAFASMAAELLRKFRTMIRLKGMEVTVDDRLEGDFLADPDLLIRVLQNLLTNALNHTPEGGRIELAAAEGRDAQAGGVVLRARDNGNGIPLKNQGRIFQKFTQAHDGQGPRTSTGLGLTFCKMVVQAHGGRIWFESREGEGATFYVWLPRQAEPSPASEV
ncbi:MAG: PAS domain-containing sensor histidine kinase [Pseudomonadota bacterium]